MAAAVIVIVLAAAGTAWDLSRSSGASYRTALASNGTVVQSLSSTGTVSQVSHADETFQVAGTVAHVGVKAGQKVHAGQVLAHLDRSTLRGELRSARSTLASARNRISGDETGQSTGSEGSSGSGSAQTFEAAKPSVVLTSPPTGGSGSGGPSGGTGTGGGNSGVSGLQTAVRAAQQATDQDLSESTAALQAANVACSASTATAPTATAPTSTATPATDPTPDPSTTSGSSSDACTAASAALLSDQQNVSRDEQQLATAETALNKELSALIDSEKQGSGSSSSASGSSTPSRTKTGGSTTASAADIALDQATIDQAQATVLADEADLAQATLRATISGHVAAVTVAHGDEVSASSTEPAVVLVGSHQEQVTIDLSATDIRDVKAGLTAHVVADGSTRSLTGRVVDVDSAGVESTSGAVSYPVTVALPSGTNVVGGAAAAVTVVVATVDDVLAVPTSAVHYSGTTTYVEVLRGGKETRRTVKVGAIGAALTQVASGLTAGQQVVLADIGAAVPSSSSTLTRGGGFGGGGFGGAGGGGAGFTRRFAGGGGTTTAVGAPPG
jgi:HlyD family secretion protein